MQNKNSNNKDRRIFERVAVSHAIRFFDLYHQQEGEGKTVDVSAKGIGLLTKQQLRTYTPLEIWIDIPSHSQPFYARAEVVWSKPSPDGQIRAGVCFERADLMGVAQLLRVK